MEREQAAASALYEGDQVFVGPVCSNRAAWRTERRKLEVSPEVGELEKTPP